MPLSPPNTVRGARRGSGASRTWYAAIRVLGSSSHRKKHPRRHSARLARARHASFSSQAAQGLVAAQAAQLPSSRPACVEGVPEAPRDAFWRAGGRFAVREVPGADVPAGARVAFGGGFQASSPVGAFEIHTKCID